MYVFENGTLKVVLNDNVSDFSVFAGNSSFKAEAAGAYYTDSDGKRHLFSEMQAKLSEINDENRIGIIIEYAMFSALIWTSMNSSELHFEISAGDDRGEIDYPKAAHPNLQVILTQKACDTYSHDTAPGATVILDDFFVTDPPKLDADIYLLPIVRTAREKLGREIVVNMVALGTAAKVLEDKGLVQPQAVKDAILARVPKGTEELNERAFDEGYKMMSDAVAARK